jgi:endonuclease VIII
MPEGDTIFRLAARLHAALSGACVRTFELPRQSLPTEHLIGAEITQIQALGKNLLIHFSDTHVLHTHLKMLGRWQLVRRGCRLTRPTNSLVVHIATDTWDAGCYHAPIVRLLTRAQAKRDPLLRSLGPDLLNDEFDLEAAVTALAGATEPSVADALLNQRYVAGIGNVYKSELLHIAGLDPFAPTAAFTRDELSALMRTAQSLLRRNVTGAGDNYGPAHNAYVRTTRSGCEVGKGPVAVYGRNGERCFSCETRIERRYQGVFARSTYYCPTCQPPRTVTPIETA